jgi:mannose-6-phosphate isomerase-like protein (cupin superfamily)
MRTTALTLIALFGAASAAMAQSAPNKPPTDASLYVSASDLQNIMQAVPMKDGKPGAFSKRLFADSTYSAAFIRLNEPDQPHAHGTWSEVFVVQQGAGVLETGGTITGVTGHDSATHKSIFVDPPKAQADAAQTPAIAAAPARNGTPGDLAGTAIEGGHQQAVKTGDVILVPAGVAHHWLKVDQPVVYLDIKFPKAD